MRPCRRCRSLSRLRICACTEMSRAEVGSSRRITSGLGDQRPGDGDALALAAGELVRIAVQVVRRGSPPGPPPRAAARRSSARVIRPRRWTCSGSPMTRHTGRRGSREDWGSWNTICIRPCAVPVGARAPDPPAGGPHQADEHLGQGGLAAAGLAHHAQGLARADVQVHAVQGVHVLVGAAQPVLAGREAHLQVLQGEDAVRPGHGRTSSCHRPAGGVVASRRVQGHRGRPGRAGLPGQGAAGRRRGSPRAGGSGPARCPGIASSWPPGRRPGPAGR